MTEDTNTQPSAADQPHKGAQQQKEFTINGETIDTQVTADWLTLYKDDNPTARLFHTAYIKSGSNDAKHPLVFCVNGGPGASSTPLHFSCIGPLQVAISENGGLDLSQKQLVPNNDSWLPFADLVFIDPIGTGYSHRIVPEDKDEKEKAEKDKNEFWATKKDLDSIGEFMRRFLTKHKLWSRPIYFTGESYGGYRAGRMAALLGGQYGIGTEGVIVISPIWQFADVSGADYSASQWINQLPTYAATAHQAGLGRVMAEGDSMDAVLEAVENFAVNDFARALVSGDLMPESERHAILEKAADWMGLDTEQVVRSAGRILIDDFARQLSQHKHEIHDLYDGSLRVLDPFPHRTNNEQAIRNSLFAELHQLTLASQLFFAEFMGVETQLEYKLLNFEVFKAWKDDEKELQLDEPTQSADDFRKGMTNNQHMKAMIVHGRFDSVTPYFASKRLLAQCQFHPSVKERITNVLYDGGHMFYWWPEVKQQFTADVKAFLSVDG